MGHHTSIPCPGCAARFAERDGPTHRYMESSPGCWAAFGEVLAREYSDSTHFVVHRLSVDSYAVQHPGRPSPQTIQSVGLHLIRLCLFLEQGLTPQRANDAMLAATRVKHRFVWLQPPASMGTLTVADVVGATDAGAHRAAVRSWATSAWQAWSQHHATIATWLPQFGN